MTKLLAIVKKEWLLLLRDFAGLLIIFILPMILVLFLSLTQAKALGDDIKVHLLVASDNTSPIAKQIVTGLEKVKSLVITNIEQKPVKLAQAKQMVDEGKYQGLVVIPNNIHESVNTFAANLRAAKQSTIKQQHVDVWFDPTLSTQIKGNVELILQLVMQQLNQQLKDTIYQQFFPTAKDSINKDLLNLTIQHGSGNALLPNAVQQNVPAWAIFGMFFILVPLASVMVRERQAGVMQRLQLAPVSAINLLMGKIIAFTMINLIQLWLIILEGVYILPLLGLPNLTISNHLMAIWVIGICTALAATGFGLFIGAFARTYEQASIVAPFVVVIGAAIGGILVPVFAMPSVLQHIAHYSPLNWSLQAFLEVFVRQATAWEVKNYLVKLLIFFIIITTLAALRMGTSRARISEH